jgi:hypothetical protein
VLLLWLLLQTGTAFRQEPCLAPHLQDVPGVVLIKTEGGLLRCIRPAQLHTILGGPLLQAQANKTVLGM